MSELDGESGGLAWRKSSFSGVTNCVELARIDGSVALRDSKHPERGYFVYTGDEWHSFVQGVRAGEFDDLV